MTTEILPVIFKIVDSKDQGLYKYTFHILISIQSSVQMLGITGMAHTMHPTWSMEPIYQSHQIRANCNFLHYNNV